MYDYLFIYIFILLIYYLAISGRLVVTSPRESVEIPRTFVRFSLSFPEEDLCPVHEFSWWSLGRNAVGRQMMWRLRGRLADSGPRGPIKVSVTVDGDWRNCNWPGWWPFQNLPPSHYSNAVLGFLANDNGADRWLQACSTYSRGRVFGSVFFVGSSMTNIEKGCKPQYSCSGGSPVLGLELHLLSLELLRVAYYYGECCVFVLTLYFFV